MLYMHLLTRGSHCGENTTGLVTKMTEVDGGIRGLDDTRLDLIDLTCQTLSDSN